MNNIIVLDFETFYSDEFSLTKLPTEEYIRSKEFEVICCGVKVNDAPTIVLDPEEIKPFLLASGIEQAGMVCHHTAFDGLILSHHFGLKPKLYLDTLSMARPLVGLTESLSLSNLVTLFGLGAKGFEVNDAKGKRRKDFTPQQLYHYKQYCANDVDLTQKLFLKLYPSLPKQEIKFIDLTLRCYCNPLLELDQGMLEEYADEIRSKKEFILQELDITEKDLRSDKKFADILVSLGVDPPTKINSKGQIKFAFAKTDEDFRELEDHPDETVSALVGARLGVKTTGEESRCNRLLGIAERGKLPVPMTYYGAHTGRVTGWDNINTLNFKKGSRIRKAIKAPKGYKIADCDSSQIECRANGWFSGQEDLIQGFREKRDIYSEFATKLMRKPVTKANVDERFIGKQSILGFGFQMGTEKFRKTVETLSMVMLGKKIEVSLRMAEDAKNLYRNENTHIKNMWYICERALYNIATGNEMEFGIGCRVRTCGEGLIMPTGMLLRYPDLRQEDGEWKYSVKRGRNKTDRKIFGGKVLENIIQHLARNIVMHQWNLISKKYEVVMHVYDANAALIPENELEEGLAYIQECMRSAPAWATGLPLDCEIGYGDNYGEC